MTNSLNPIAIVLPCHRVVGSNASLTGYAGGLDRKQWLLRHENAKLIAKEEFWGHSSEHFLLWILEKRFICQPFQLKYVIDDEARLPWGAPERFPGGRTMAVFSPTTPEMRRQENYGIYEKTHAISSTTGVEWLRDAPNGAERKGAARTRKVFWYIPGWRRDL
jgi:hypothetical protein